MLSILVPIYNFDITVFVNDLNQQCSQENIDFEIICLDDGSLDKYKNNNAIVDRLTHVSYHELKYNVGRSVIRNKLARMAKYDKLLFVDCDSITEDKKYINNYISCIHDHLVIYGGRSYDRIPPKSKTLYLRWYYGIKREVKSAHIRLKEPYRNCMTNNFIIDKQLVFDFPFDEGLTGYGYEDLAFSYRLKSNGISIHHIDNNLRHIGLETSEDFMNKTANGMRNLAQLIKSKTIDEDIKIYRFYLKCKQYKIQWLILLLWRSLHKTVKKNIMGPKPDLRYLDFFKLHELIKNAK